VTTGKVKDSGVTQISVQPQRWIAFYTIETPRPGYDIPPTEDYWATFETEQEAQKWLRDHVGN